MVAKGEVEGAKEEPALSSSPPRELGGSHWLVGVNEGPAWALRESWQGSLSTHLTGKFQSELRGSIPASQHQRSLTCLSPFSSGCENSAEAEALSVCSPVSQVPQHNYSVAKQ